MQRMEAEMKPVGLAGALSGFAVAAMAMMPSAAHAFSASYSWQGIGGCGTTSPPFHLSDVPRDTVALRFEMHDLQAPRFHHGGSTVAYHGSDSVPKGTIRYTGPCPPPNTRHTYRWTIEALGSNGQVLATTTTSAVFPPKR